MLFSSPTCKSLDMGGVPGDDIVRSVKQAVDQNGLEPVELQTFGAWGLLGLSGLIGTMPASPSDPEYEAVRKRGVQQFIKIIKMCRALGCDQITAELGGSPIYHHDHEEAWTKSVKDLSPILREEGIRIAVMPHPGDFLEESDPVWT